MAIEDVFITVTIDAYKNHDVTTVDLPSVFLHTDTDPKDGIVQMVIRNQLCELMVKVNLSLYQKYVIHDKKRKILLYVELQKVVYGRREGILVNFTN